jgi:ABC-type bacteriocin/lantibiotic exporter with double-glycine peptidase domain
MAVLCGGSGSGKSTLARLLAGGENPTEGAIRLDGTRLDGPHRTGPHARIALVQETIDFSEGSLWQTIASGGSLSLEAAWAAAEQAGVAGAIRAMPMQMHTLVGMDGRNLSLGQRRQIALARALATAPALLVLDEPAGGLDHRTTSRLWQAVRALKMSRVVLTQTPQVLAGDRLFHLEQGTLRRA